MKICSVDGCLNPTKGRGYCRSHYKRWHRHGNPLGGRDSSAYRGACTLPNCEKQHLALGYCDSHYRAFKKHGDPLFRVHPLKKIEKTPKVVFEYHSRLKTVDKKGCWIPKNKPSPQGYVSVSVVVNERKRASMLHRIALAATIGFDLDSEETVHHKCANQSCFNPDHLQPISQRENTAEMLERNFYLTRINELEKTVAALKQQLEIKSIF